MGKEGTTRMNFYMKNSFVKALDEYADSLGVTRPAALSFIIAQWIDSRNALNSFNNLGEYANKSDKTDKSDKTKK